VIEGDAKCVDDDLSDASLHSLQHEDYSIFAMLVFVITCRNKSNEAAIEKLRENNRDVQATQICNANSPSRFSEHEETC